MLHSVRLTIAVLQDLNERSCVSVKLKIDILGVK